MPRCTDFVHPTGYRHCMGNQVFDILREHATATGGLAYEARSADGTRVTIWSGVSATGSTNIHPLIPGTIGSGTLDDAPIWIELRPGRLVLAKVLEKANRLDRVHWAAQICDAVAALHAIGKVHGCIDEHNVIIDDAGVPFLIGHGQSNGTTEMDLAAIHLLTRTLAPKIELPNEQPSAAALSARLREYASTLEERTPIQLTADADPPLLRTISIELIPTGPMDEVRVDIGHDAVGPGLLDRWSQPEDPDELTEDQTESVDRSLLHTQTQQSIEAAVDHALADIVEQLDNKGISVGADFRTMILGEAPDPLPIPEGLPHGRIHNPKGDAERTAEVPHALNFPDNTANEETTGITNTASIQPALLTGLWAAVLVGMLGAMIMLLLVWGIIGGVS